MINIHNLPDTLTTTEAMTEVSNPVAKTITGGMADLSPNTSAAIQGMEQLAADGFALQLADLQLQTKVQPVKRLANAAKTELS